MARLAFSPAPDLGSGAVYGEYMPWLLHDFYDRLCGYCLLHHLALTIDHYVPQGIRSDAGA